MTGVLVNRLRDVLQGNQNGPGSRPGRLVVEGDLMVERVGTNPRESLGEAKPLRRAPENIEDYFKSGFLWTKSTSYENWGRAIFF